MSQVASELGLPIAKVKRGVSAILFGMNYQIWRKQNGVDDSRRSSSFERLEKEVTKIRAVVVDIEVQSNRASAKTKDTKTLSKTVERIEERIMGSLSGKLAEKGWATTTLIHDELILKHSARFENHSDESTSLARDSASALRIFEESCGWPPGTLAVKICSL